MLPKSQSTILTQKTSSSKSLAAYSMVNFPTEINDDITDLEFKSELFRQSGAIYFGSGILQLAFSFLPPQLKIINIFGYEGDRNEALKYLTKSKNTADFRSMLSTITLLWYYLILTPFFSLESSDLSDEINNATQILNDNESLDQSALFLYFSGRRQRLKKKIKYATIHYDAAIRTKNIPRELKILVMHELGICLLIQLNYNDAMHYFNELKVSKFSKSYYIYLTTICKGAAGDEENFTPSVKIDLMNFINSSPQKEGSVEKFILNRSNLVLNENEPKESSFWQLLCFEVMYFWNLLSSCDETTLNSIIKTCKDTKEEPIMGLSFFIIALCFNLLKDYENSVHFYKACLEKCNEIDLQLQHIPAYASYELSLLQYRIGNVEDAKNHLQNIQNYKNFDFEQRLKLKIPNIKL